MKLLTTIISSIEDIKGEDIKIMDLREIETASCDYFVICTGNTNTQVSSICKSIERNVRKELSEKPWDTEGQENSEWVLMDYVSIMVHVFQPAIRDRYNLESLWGDAKFIEIN